MKHAIFYFSLHDNGVRNERVQIMLADPRYIVYIRSEVVDAQNSTAALDMANPQPDESVMNAHSLEE